MFPIWAGVAFFGLLGVLGWANYFWRLAHGASWELGFVGIAGVVVFLALGAWLKSR